MAENKTVNGAKHRVIEEHLLAQIESGKFKVGELLNTGRGIAKEYSVSRPTADKAVTSLVARGYLERTQGLGTFVSDWKASRRSVRQGNSISVIHTIQHQDFYGQFVHDASKEAEAHGYHLTIGSLSDEDDCDVPLAIKDRQAVGSLVISPLNDAQARALLAEDLPCLFIGNHRQTFGQPCVRFDIEDAGYQIAKKLLELDRGPVWLLLEPTTKAYYSFELLEGYQRAIIERPGAHCNVHISRGEGFEEDDYARLAEQIRADGQRQFCAMGDNRYIYRLGQQFGSEVIDLNQSAVTLAGTSEQSWPYADRMLLCDISLSKGFVEGVQQIVAMAQTGAPVTGKTFKLHIETVDDPAKPWRFVWQ